MSQKLFSSFIAAFTLLLMACNSDAQTDGKQDITTPVPIQVIQFHATHRCETCLKIEKLARQILSDHFAAIPFKLVNVDDRQNAKMAEEFEATGTALFLYNPKTGKKKDLTKFAFMNAWDDKKFEAEFKKDIEDFLKS